MNKPYRILSLDGGGSWSLLQILTLKEIFGDAKGHEILKHFDLVVANSGGSIVLTALACNWSLDKALGLFNDQSLRQKVFHKLPFNKKYFPIGITSLFGIGPRYDAGKKLDAFNELFKEVSNIPLNEIPQHVGNPNLKVIVATFDSLKNRAKFFRSYFNPDSTYYPVTLPQAIHGSSNAPVNYFDFPAQVDVNESDRTYHLWDGALGGFNNPVAAGVIEAVKNRVPKKDMMVLSIGTGAMVMSEEAENKFLKLIKKLKRSRKNLGGGVSFFFKTVLNMANTILYEPPDWANYVAYILQFDHDYTNPENNDRFVRLSPYIYGEKSQDEATRKLIKALSNLDMDLTREEDVQLLMKCFESWKAGHIRNQLLKLKLMPDGEVKEQIGHRTFEEGVSAWKRSMV